MKYLRHVLLLSLLTGLVACSSDKVAEPAQLVDFNPSLSVDRTWHHNSGTSGVEYLNLNIAADDHAIYVVNGRGDVQALSQKTGTEIWYTKLHVAIRGGVGVGQGLVIVSDDRGNLYALDAKQGKLIWQTNVGNIVLAPASVNANAVVVKTVADTVLKLDPATGKTLWKFGNNTPDLTLRNGGQPQITANKVIVGLSSGTLQVLDLTSGVPIWQQPISEAQGSFDVERMIDIAASPIVNEGIVYAASYQGNIVALQINNAQKLWSHQLSSYTGLAFGLQRLFVTDADSDIWCFDPTTGTILWHQDEFANRSITAPAIQGNAVVVGDAQGYVHWVSGVDGHLLARVRLSTLPIVSAPVVVGNILYVIDVEGHLGAYQIESKS